MFTVAGQSGSMINDACLLALTVNDFVRRRRSRLRLIHCHLRSLFIAAANVFILLCACASGSFALARNTQHTKKRNAERIDDDDHACMSSHQSIIIADHSLAVPSLSIDWLETVSTLCAISRTKP